jgi:hypothetical protein
LAVEPYDDDDDDNDEYIIGLPVAKFAVTTFFQKTNLKHFLKLN